MKYMGSKRSRAKALLSVMLEDRRPKQTYIEPFCGGCNVIDRVTEGPRIANDSHPYLIALLTAIRDGWIPPSKVSHTKFYKIKAKPDDYPAELVGFVGFCCSYFGQWWGSYDKGSGLGLNRAAEGMRNLRKQAPNLQGIKFKNVDYKKLYIPKRSIVYCDPPFKDKYKYTKGSSFDYLAFYDWCRLQKKKGHTVFVSEITMPKDFKSVWHIEMNNMVHCTNGSNSYTEHLFKPR